MQCIWPRFLDSRNLTLAGRVQCPYKIFLTPTPTGVRNK